MFQNHLYPAFAVGNRLGLRQPMAGLLRLFLQGCCGICLGGAVGLCFPARLPFSLPPAGRYALFAALVAAACLFFLFACGAAGRRAALFLQAAGIRAAEPRYFLTLRGAFLCLRAVLLKTLCSLLWAAFFFLPAGALLTVARFHAAYGMAKNVLATLLLGSAVLFIAGAGFLPAVLRRYRGLPLVLAAEPRLPVRQALRQSIVNS